MQVYINIKNSSGPTWPDFGVPESPASFLNFLFKVRESGSLSPEHGPAVVHCSAGIGRSGTFSLVDTCLVLVSDQLICHHFPSPDTLPFFPIFGWKALEVLKLKMSVKTLVRASHFFFLIHVLIA